MRSCINRHLIELSLSFIFETRQGIMDIQASVEAKTMVVTHEDSVSKQEMLEKLQNVSSHDKGGSVCLISILCFFIFLFWLYFCS